MLRPPPSVLLSQEVTQPDLSPGVEVAENREGRVRGTRLESCHSPAVSSQMGSSVLIWEAAEPRGGAQAVTTADSRSAVTGRGLSKALFIF